MILRNWLFDYKYINGTVRLNCCRFFLLLKKVCTASLMLIDITLYMYNFMFSKEKINADVFNNFALLTFFFYSISFMTPDALHINIIKV